MANSRYTAPRWDFVEIFALSNKWLKKKRAQKWAWGELSPWWRFVFEWDKKIADHIHAFIKGTYTFSPLKVYHFRDQSVSLWECADRLILHLIHQTIKPLFSHILSPLSFNLQPDGVQKALHLIQKALNTGRFRYVIRTDVRSYYASVDHKILLASILGIFQDPRLQHYFAAIITVPIDNNAVLFTPDKGIPLCSSLSPFFGALYLTPLDRAFEKRKGLCYVRFMDDVLILAETKKQFTRANKLMKKHFSQLKLSFSRQKTKRGALKAFHFLGIQFEVTQTTSDKNQLTISLHPRSCRRALDKATCMKADAAPTADVQTYLSKGWANWWLHASGSDLSVTSNLIAWVNHAIKLNNPLAWVGRGMIPFSLLGAKALSKA